MLQDSDGNRTKIVKFTENEGNGVKIYTQSSQNKKDKIFNVMTITFTED